MRPDQASQLQGKTSHPTYGPDQALVHQGFQRLSAVLPPASWHHVSAAQLRPACRIVQQEQVHVLDRQAAEGLCELQPCPTGSAGPQMHALHSAEELPKQEKPTTQGWAMAAMLLRTLLAAVNAQMMSSPPRSSHIISRNLRHAASMGAHVQGKGSWAETVGPLATDCRTWIIALS